MLTLKNISAVIDAKDLLNNVSFTINPGEIHAILGPRQSGKSSLVHLISGHPSIIKSEGEIFFEGKNISKLDPEDRLNLGIYSTFTEPPEITSLTNFSLAKLVLRARKDPRSDNDLERDYKVLCRLLELGQDHGDKPMDYDLMSGADFRKNEILLMLLINPKLAIIDDLDKDLSDDDLAILGAVLSSYLDENNSILVISNNRRFLDMLVPTHVYVLVDGKIKESGDASLYKRIEEDDYSQFS